ncbi:TonB-dependent receptor [Adhaeribacter sp. BT258]|uniref:TonB-dependent receptor n=1 Tax=Adhaeribacter terrigena TaxID=2793070 RepID=A0ABS1C1H4_9BACT|nr:outer membrane beta-barrel family protein [Adhaeribacter terrigena]MBK0403232.1 TonB-dependent receptor [Adhaeribacter terrigena]
MKNCYLLIFAFICCALSPAFAQETGLLKGTLKDGKGNPVGFANVALVLQETGAVKTGTMTDEKGNFQLKTPAPGTYFLRCTFLGFQPVESESFVVSGENFSRDFGVLVLKEDAQTLKEVTVQTMRPTITTHPDKMVMSVEGTAMAAGSSAYDILTKAPGVWLDQDGNIQLNGKAGVQVMIDGKLTYLSGKELQTFLEGMSADNIKDLEIITNPSAKYDAEGSAGIINLNLKKNSLSGFNGSVYAGYQNNTMHGYTYGGNLNYKKGKWSSAAMLDVSRRTRVRTNTMHRAFNEEGNITTLMQKGKEGGATFIPNLRLSTDYEISPKHSLGVMANLTYQDQETDFDTDSYLRTGSPENDLFIQARNHTQKKFGNGTFNLHYSGKLDTLGSTLSADLDYANLLFKGSGDFRNYYQPADLSGPAFLDQLGSNNPSGYQIWSAKTDYARPVWKNGKLELGAKASHVVSDNDLQFYLVKDGRKTPDPLRSNHFIYTENIYAAYTNFQKTLSDKIQVQAGLRAEQTVAEGHSVTLNDTKDRKYFGLFPSVFLQHKVSDKYQLNYNFSRRLDRPGYNSLNPFIFYLDPYSWAKGNPDLKPQYTNSFQITQTYKDAYSLILGYANTAGFMAEIPLQNNENKTTEFQTRNVDNFENANATLVLPVKISPKWEVSNNLNLEYQNYTIFLAEKHRQNEQVFFFAQSNHSLQLPKDIRLEVNGGYQGPSAYGLYKIEQNWWVDAGLKRSFMKNQLDLSVNVTDIFKTRWVVGAANFDGNINAFDQYFGMQSFRVNLRYRFSRGEKFELKRRNNSLEELRRTGN